MERPKYGMITKPSDDMSKSIREASRQGFDYVELFIEIPAGHPDDLIKKRKSLLKTLERFRHPPVGHTPYWTDLWSDYEEVREAWIRVCKKSIDAARSLGCRKLNIHAPILFGMYMHVKSHQKHALSNAIKSLRELVRYAKRKKVLLMLENMDSVWFRDFQYLLKNVSGLGVHVDVGHAFLEGGMPVVTKYIKTFRKSLEHLHFSDNLGILDDHYGLGQGMIDFIEVMKLLRSIKYDKTITLEIFSGREDAVNSLRIIREIEEDVWQI